MHASAAESPGPQGVNMAVPLSKDSQEALPLWRCTNLVRNKSGAASVVHFTPGTSRTLRGRCYEPRMGGQG